MDALSDVLKSVRLEGAVYLEAEFTAPWCVRAKHGLASVKRRLAGAEHFVFFHYFARGGCKVPLADGAMLDVHQGDLVLFPRDDEQRMGSHPHLEPVEAASFTREEAEAAGKVIRIRHGGGGEATHIICGYFASGGGVSRPLFDALPRVVRIPIGNGPAALLLQQLLREGVRESAADRPGAESMLAKLAEFMFVEALRHYVESLPADGRGWLAGVRDAHVGRALALMHGEPRTAWTVERLSREVALSRSTLAERFTSLVGEPPMQYLTRWRLALAARALRGTGQSIARIAEHAGYDSDAAFSRAFKREFGKPPATWRRTR